IITIGLRGENDTPMIPGGSLTEDTTLLGNIIRVEENILAEEINQDVAKVPQLWCPYSEVLGYYNAGFRVPDDATILWPDNNFGDIRRLPTDAERERSGGAGVYYHFDLHGGPRSYQWINTNALPKIWDQMTLAKEYGADRVWIVNVGHLKGYELPISYFMDLAWSTNRWTNSNIDEYALMWARQQFGPEHASQIANILLRYSKYNSRRKPELLTPKTYSIVDYNEAENVVADFKSITDEAEKIYNEVPADQRDAFYELVLFPTKASYILNDMYYAGGSNELYAKQGRAATNEMSSMTRDLFIADTTLMEYFNQTFDGGKWDGFMDQPFIGYKSWSQPPANNLDAIDLKNIDVPEAANMGVAVEGSESAWPGTDGKPILPGFDPFNETRHYVVVFNKGKVPFKFTARSDKSWIQVSTHTGEVEDQTKLWINIDWKKVPKGMSAGNVVIDGTGQEISVSVNAINPTKVAPKTLNGFVEEDGCVSIEAAHYAMLTDDGIRHWLNVQDYGRTLSGMRATAPLDFPDTGLVKNAPYIEYKMFVFDSGNVDVQGIFSATLNFNPDRGLHYAISFDDQAPVIVALIPENSSVGLFTPDRARTMMGNARYSDTTLTIARPGYHTLKVWMIDPGVLLEKIVLNFGGVKPSYLGPPESFHRNVANEK
ncbi:MAG: glycosyl hydrolase 115 family protein, partial [Candidatus Kryptoniota bacterium]